MIIIADSDGLIGISNPNDGHYLNSTNLLKKLNQLNAKFIYPSTAIAEATAILQIRLNKQDSANQIIEFVRSGLFQVEPVDQETLIEASYLLDQKRSKHATLFDAIVAAVAKKYNADAIFSFDRFYKTKGFKLAEDLK